MSDFSTDPQPSPAVAYVPHSVIDRHGPELGAHGIAVLAMMIRHAGAHGRSFPPINHVAAATGMTAAVFWRELTKLEKLGLLTIDRRPGKAARFSLTIDQPTREAI